MWTRAELKDNAKQFFRFNYWKMVLVALILLFAGGSGGSSFAYSRSDEDMYGFPGMSSAEIMTFVSVVLAAVAVFTVVAFIIQVFLFNPLYIGGQRFFVVSHYQKAELSELGYAFSHSYPNVVKTMFLRQLFVFLWSLLFIIPGIIKAYEYRMIHYILAENPGIDSKEAFAMSKQMMDGNKWNTFVLDLSFMGWVIVSLFTCGLLAIFYVNPYIFMTNAELYVALKEITYGGRGQYNGQNMNQQWNNSNQWDNNGGQWNNNDQWDNNSPM